MRGQGILMAPIAPTALDRCLRVAKLTFLICLLAACAQQPLSTLSTEQQVKLLQKADKYGAAARILESVEPPTLESGKISALKKHNAEIAELFEQRVINDLGVLQKNAKWGEATALIDQSLGNFPESSRLDTAAKELKSARDTFQHNKLIEHRILRAKRLPGELENLHALDDASSDPALAAEYQRLLLESDATAEALLAEGQTLMAQKQWKRADQLLKLSFALRNDQRTSTALRLTKSNYSPKRRQRSAKRLGSDSAEMELQAVEFNSAQLAATAMRRYRELLQQNELAAARLELNRAEQLLTEDQQIQRETLRLDGLIASAVKTRVEQGKYEYSLGNMEQAIGHWEYAFALAPADEALKERLEKARLFKERYEKLKR